jgi:hypothetical protein
MAIYHLGISVMTQHQAIFFLIILIIPVTIITSLVNVSTAYVFIFLLISIGLSVIVAHFFIAMLANWLKEKFVFDLSKLPVHRNYLYRPIEKNDYLKDKTEKLMNIDRQSLDRNRLSEAELDSIDDLFKDTLSYEIDERLRRLANGETELFKILGIKHDLWSLVFINLALLFMSFILVLYLVFLLRYFYHFAT